MIKYLLFIHKGTVLSVLILGQGTLIINTVDLTEDIWLLLEITGFVKNMLIRLFSYQIWLLKLVLGLIETHGIDWKDM